MTLDELINEMRVRVGGLNEPAKVAAYISDLTFAGLVDGPELRTAFDGWRLAWAKKYPPTPAEFLEFYSARRHHHTKFTPMQQRWREIRNGLLGKIPNNTPFAKEMTALVAVKLIREDPDGSIVLEPRSLRSGQITDEQRWWPENLDRVERVLGVPVRLHNCPISKSKDRPSPTHGQVNRLVGDVTATLKDRKQEWIGDPDEEPF